METLNMTALSGPLPARVLPFVLQLSSGSMLLATLAAGVVGILWASFQLLRRRHDRPATTPLRLVVPARTGR